MTITAKYAGRCRSCGGAIHPGDRINWERGMGAEHVECPARQDETPSEDAIRLRSGSGYGGSGWTEGQVVKASPKTVDEHGLETPYLTVVSSSEHYYREDGLCFGVGDDRGYVYGAICRPATDEEAAPLREREQRAAEKRAAQGRIKEIAAEIMDRGERPEGMNAPEGDRLFDTQNIYGGGEWFVVGREEIWYVRNNGMDGDDWSHNNVLTGGAGAIGWRIAADEALAAELRRNAEQI